MHSSRGWQFQAAWCAVWFGWHAAVAAQEAPNPNEVAESTQTDEAAPAEAVGATPAQLNPPPPPPPPPSVPSPFQFSFKGTVALTLYAQDTPIITGNGVGTLAGPAPILGDSWHMGGDIRQSRFSLSVRGPELLGAIPTASIEMEMAGGNQIYTIPGPPSTVVVRDAMGMPVGTANVPGFTSSAQGDESLLPRLRTAYVEFNWDAGTNVLRAGQYHNLLLAMVSASGAHPATLGYLAGQLGWRTPGLTYSHKFRLSADTSLDAAVQLNRNSWNDNAPACGPGMAPPAMNCLPAGVSLGEAGLPQVEARLLLSGPLTESMWPHYAPTVWQLHVIGHWDRKDLSGVNATAPAGMRDTMTTYAVEAGGKYKLGPVQLAVNGWYGQNTGSLFGNIAQLQAPDKPDVQGFGVWGQLGIMLFDGFSLWGFTGIDRPNRDQALAAGFTRLQNMQIAVMLAYVNGPLMATLEWLNITTVSPNATMPGQTVSYSGNQPSFTIAYAF